MNIAKLSPTARIEEMRFRVFQMTRFNFHQPISFFHYALRNSDRNCHFMSVEVL